MENPLLIGRLPPLAGVEESGSIPCLGPLDTVGEGDLKWGRHRVQADRCLFLRGHIGKNNLKCQNEHCTSCFHVFVNILVGVVLHVCIRVALVWGWGRNRAVWFWIKLLNFSNNWWIVQQYFYYRLLHTMTFFYGKNKKSTKYIDSTDKKF